MTNDLKDLRARVMNSAACCRNLAVEFAGWQKSPNAPAVRASIGFALDDAVLLESIWEQFGGMTLEEYIAARESHAPAGYEAAIDTIVKNAGIQS